MSETGKSGATSGSGMNFTMTPRMWAGVAIAVVAILFIAQNREPANITLLWVHLVSPLWLTLTIVFLAGMLSGWLIARRHK